MSAASIVRAAMDDRNHWAQRGGWGAERISRWCTEDVKMTGHELPMPPVSSGPAELEASFRAFEEPWEEIGYEITGSSDLSDEVSVLGVHYRARAREIEVDQVFWWAARAVGSRIDRLHMTGDRDSAVAIAEGWL